MNLHFSFNKAYTDLFNNKKYVWELLSFVLMFYVVELFQSVIKSSSSNSFISIMLGGYLCIMANNIIHDKEPVLGDIFKRKDNKISFIFAGFKQGMVQVAYFAVLAIVGCNAASFLKNSYGISNIEAWVLIAVIMLPVIVFLVISSFVLVSENLSFRDGFNLIKALKSFKYAWKEYIIAGALYIISLILIALIISIAEMIFKNQITSQVGAVITYLTIVISSYFSSHLIAQAYKYSLIKMKSQEAF